MNDVLKKLNEPIPQDAILTRAQSGVNLSYLSGHYVINRLNQVLGTDNWDWTIQSLTRVEGAKRASFVCVGVLTAIIDYRKITKTGIGYGSDKSDYNTGEMAVKECETDSLKRAAMKLGKSMGLELYFKDGEYTGDEETQTAQEAAKEPSTKIKTETENAPIVSRGTKILKKKIKSIFSVLEAKKAITRDDFVSNYLEGAKVDDLTDAQVTSVLTRIETVFATELGLNA